MTSICANSTWPGHGRCGSCPIQHALHPEYPLRGEIDRILQDVSNRVRPPQTMLFSRGECASGVHIVRSGLVKLVHEFTDGSYRIVRLLHPGSVCGLEAATGSHYHHTAITLEHCDLCHVPQEVLSALDGDHPAWSRELFAAWQQSLDEADEFITSLATGNANQRLASLLLQLCRYRGRNDYHPLGREDIGALLGVTMETASRIMADFKRRGLVREEGNRHGYCDIAGLRRIAAGDGDDASTRLA